MAELTRKEFYELADQCRERALELAHYDQNRVNRKQCRLFNMWLARLKTYDQLAPSMQDISAARPITRYDLMAAAVVLWVISLFLLRDQLGMGGNRVLAFGAWGLVILLYFLPESLYATTVELLEAKVLRIVEALEELLISQEMEVTEAVFFKIKENLNTARRELRQQIHLAHRR
ncbi:MAG: hypothetical protein F4148_13935 [Caldilineaceae bacterium SB0675_bin_29]|uniref:Uncharacterized protein n=1 Tax=Caldilineaceae bacterium SB0675_bin_29 TaxID=2605266 RepID=A0A6B1G5W5_9CHLR|nr:hypothetical protein [Caldilineaceae bacterium SB0675_bin_29]